MPLNALGRLVELVAKLPPAAIEALISLVRGALSSDDPERYIARRATADATHAATQATARELLSRRTRPPK